MKPRVLPGIRRILTREYIPILEKFDTVKAFFFFVLQGKEGGFGDRKLCADILATPVNQRTSRGFH